MIVAQFLDLSAFGALRTLKLMSESPSVNNNGNTVRVLARDQEPSLIESDWVLVRFEPDSGNLVAEKNGKRIVCPRTEYECLNFPGSDEVWHIITENNTDPDLAKACSLWAKLDLTGLTRALIAHTRTLDPAFRGVQTLSDLSEKIHELHGSCQGSMEVLRLEMKRAEAEYNRCPNRTSFESDQKDNLLEHWHNLQNRYAARLYQHEKLIPAWDRLIAALENLNAISNKEHQTSP
jgi:hypothetical protein